MRHEPAAARLTERDEISSQTVTELGALCQHVRQEGE